MPHLTPLQAWNLFYYHTRESAATYLRVEGQDFILEGGSRSVKFRWCSDREQIENRIHAVVNAYLRTARAAREL